MSADLYDALKAAGCETDSHESDLYVRSTAKAREIIARHPAVRAVPFRHAVTGEAWLELPFMFTPWWRARQRRASA